MIIKFPLPQLAFNKFMVFVLHDVFMKNKTT